MKYVIIPPEYKFKECVDNFGRHKWELLYKGKYTGYGYKLLRNGRYGVYCSTGMMEFFYNKGDAAEYCYNLALRKVK